MKSFRLLAIVFSLPLSGLLAADEFVWVAPGREPAPIMVAADAQLRTRAAAQELADYVEKLSGRRPKLIDGVPQPLPESAVWVGFQPALKELFPQVDFEFRHPEETLIIVGAKHLVIAGRDRWDPNQLTAETKIGRVEGVQQEYGTVNAVYSFLQDQLGVRWFWPGELGEDVVRRERIALAAQQHRYHPRIRSRNGVFHYSNLGTAGYGRSHDWTLRQRLQLDSMSMSGGHGFGDWWDRYHEKYPEIFALQPDGTRSSFPNPHNVKLCMSNPKVWELWLQDVADDLKKIRTWNYSTLLRTTVGPADTASARSAARGIIPTASPACLTGAKRTNSVRQSRIAM